MRWIQSTNTKGELPEWVEAGKNVAVVRGRGQDQSVTIKRVDKTTVTQVVVEGDRFSIKKSLELMGPRHAYTPTPFLADPNSEEVKAALLLSRLRNAKFRVDKANDEFQKDPSPTTAVELIKSVEVWRDFQRSYTDATVKQA